jgi:predicted amidohydrolase
VKVALIHHRVRGDVAVDADALVDMARRACAAGAEAVVCPHVPSLAGLEPPEREALLARVEGCLDGAALFMSFRSEETGPRISRSPLGRTALVAGDDCLREEVVRTLAADGLDTVIWRVGAESELQAEAVLEYALGCSPAIAGLLLVAECSGGEDHDGCRGASAIIHAGQMVAEATGVDDELLIAELDIPVPASEPDLPLPALPPILAQRLAVHEGRKPSVGYPAELS